MEEGSSGTATEGHQTQSARKETSQQELHSDRNAVKLRLEPPGGGSLLDGKRFLLQVLLSSFGRLLLGLLSVCRSFPSSFFGAVPASFAPGGARRLTCFTREKGF